MSTDLERSHSKWSNFKLTFKSVLLAIFSNTIWVLLYLFPILNKGLVSGLLVLNVAIIILLILLFKSFKR